jgi:hypothetical protein
LYILWGNTLKSKYKEATVLKVYFACATMHNDIPEDTRKLYEWVRWVINNLGLDPFMPHLRRVPSRISPEEVVSQSFSQIENSDILVAYLGEESVGVGIESVHALKLGIPTIGIVEYYKISLLDPRVVGFYPVLIRFSHFVSLRDQLERHLNQVLADLTVC